MRMRIFGFLDRKKQTAPSSRSSVHPASNGQDVYCVKRAKIKELLGAVTPQECQEVDELLNKMPGQVNPSSDDDDDDGDDDDAKVGDGLIRKDEEKCNHIAAMPQQKGRSISDLQFSTARVDLAAQKLAHPTHKSSLSEECATRKPCSFDMIIKASSLKVPVKMLPSNQPIHDCATQKPRAVDMNPNVSSVQESVKKYMRGRPAKLTCVNKKAVAVSSRNWLGSMSEHPMAPHPIRIRGNKSASCAESFPLPPPFYEKHYLPTPQARTSEEMFSVAHPLPQPPPAMRMSNGCVPEHSDDKGHAQIARAVSCNPLVKSQIIVNKEYTSIAHTVSLDSPKQLTHKQKTSLGGFPMPTQGLQNTPPTTPRPQAHRTLQNALLITPGMQLHQTPQSPPPATPRTQVHQTPPSTPPTTPRTQLHQTPQSTPPMTPRTQLHQTLQNTPPTTPRTQLHQTPENTLPIIPSSQLRLQVKVARNVQSPPSSNRQSPPWLTTPPCSPRPRSLCPRKWTKGMLLGQGTFGTVHEGLNLEDGSFFAVKVSSSLDTSPEIQQEVDVLSKLEHPNIVRYLGSSIVDNRLCIFLELVSMGSLDSILRNFKCFEDHTIRSYTRQILLGLEYLHAKKTIHRDIKCGNILVDVNGQVRLSDFGIAKQVDESLASSLKGTPLYMAPEVLMSSKDSKCCYSFPADIWSLGCTVFELADGKPPWSDLKGFGFLFKVKRKELPPMPEHLSADGRDFIRCCLQFLPEDRPTASQLLQHPFVLNVATPETFFPLSPSSPLSPKRWPRSSQSSSSTWACGHCFPSSPSQALGGSQRAQTLIHGR